MNRFLIISLTAVVSLSVSGDTHAQFNARTRTGHAVVGPGGGISTGQTRTAAHAGPLGSASAATRTGTRVTPGGATVQYGAAGASRSGPFGGGAAGAKGVKVTTPSGQTYTNASAGRVAAGPGGVAAAGRSRTTAAGPFGAAAVGRAGVAGFR